MRPLSSLPPDASQLLQRVKDGATVDKSLVQRALDTVTEHQLDLGAARSLVQDILTTSKDITPAACEALEAFIAASAAAPSKPASTLTGALARWMGRSPKARDGALTEEARLRNAVRSAGDLVTKSAKDVLADALERLDPVVAQTVLLDSKYSVGLTGFAKLFPALERALTTFENAHEPATALMEAALKELPAPPLLSSVLADLKGGAVLDQARALDLLRAATREGASKGVLVDVLKQANTTEAGRAFLEGFAQSLSSSVEGRYYDAYVNETRARDVLTAFDQAIGKLDPNLAKLGHSVLLLSGGYPLFNDAERKLDDLMGDRKVENWSHAALDLVAEALRGMAGATATHKT